MSRTMCEKLPTPITSPAVAVCAGGVWTGGFWADGCGPTMTRSATTRVALQMRADGTGLLLRRQLDHASRRRRTAATPTLWIGQQIQIAVRSLDDIADAFLVLLQQPLFANHFLAVHDETHQRGAAQPADEQTALPCRECVPRVEQHAARRDVRIPVVDRLLHAGLHLFVAGDASALIFDTVGDRRPAVVPALFRDVQFVAPIGAVLDFPQLTSGRVQRRRLDVAVTERPDLGSHALLADERVVLGDRAVGIQPDDLAEEA